MPPTWWENSSPSLQGYQAPPLIVLEEEPEEVGVVEEEEGWAEGEGPGETCQSSERLFVL